MRTIIPKEAKLIPKEAKQVFEGEIFDVYHWTQEMFDGSSATFEMLKRPDTIKVIALKDDKIVILEEKQPNHADFIDLPGGRHDVHSETELEAAKRELLEETGMSFGSWRLIKVEQPYSKIDWLVYLFLATGFENQREQRLDNGEKIDIKLLGLDEVKKLAGNPKARHLPAALIETCNDITDLANLPEYIE